MIDLEKWKRTTAKIKDMKVYKDNPRTITTEKLAELRESLEDIGYIDEISLFKDGTIAGGHARYYLFEADNFKGDIPVKQCTVDLSEEEMQEVVVRLNKAIAGAWNFDILNREFKVDKLLDWGFRDNQFLISTKETEEINRGDENSEWSDMEMPEFEAGGDYIKLTLHFESEEAREKYVESINLEIKKKGKQQWTAYP